MKNKTIELKSFYGLSQRKQDYYEQYIKDVKIEDVEKAVEYITNQSTNIKATLLPL